MRPTDFTERKSGRLVKHQRRYWAFVPNLLPPEIELSWKLAGEISAADRGLSELAGVARIYSAPLSVTNLSTPDPTNKPWEAQATTASPHGFAENEIVVNWDSLIPRWLQLIKATAGVKLEPA